MAFLCLSAAKSIMEAKLVSFMLQVVTVYALFGYDLRLAVFDKEADPYFEAASTVTFVIFLLELVSFASPEHTPTSSTLQQPNI